MSENNVLPLYEWEYERFRIYIFDFKKRADKFGKQGWEVINVCIQPSTHNDEVWVFLKRPKLFGTSVAEDMKREIK